jgi:hypothetical protein
MIKNKKSYFPLKQLAEKGSFALLSQQPEFSSFCRAMGTTPSVLKKKLRDPASLTVGEVRKMSTLLDTPFLLLFQQLVPYMEAEIAKTAKPSAATKYCPTKMSTKQA